METMPWQGNELDKDILGDGTHYSPKTCCFIPKSVNMFWTQCTGKRDGLVGVTFDKSTGQYKAQCKVGKRRKTLGRFPTELEAHRAWISAKAESLAILLAPLNLNKQIVEGMYKKLRAFEIQATA
ncbi:AP2 domain protein [compost metagenome]